MPRAVTKETTTKETAKNNDSYTLTLPRKLPSSITYTQILTLLLIVASFFIGTLYTKVQMLEKNGAGVVAGAQTAQNPGTQPQVGAPSVAPGQKVEVDPGHLPVRGDENAKVTIVEFSDFQCPFCQKLFQDAMPSIIKDYVDTGKAKLTFRHYPLPFHQNAQKAAEAAECANEGGKFWEMHDKLFSTQQTWESQPDADAQKTFSGYAAELGLDTGAFDTCLSSGKFKTAVTDDATAGQKAGVSATPTVFVNGIPVVGAESYEAFKQVIDAELQKS